MKKDFIVKPKLFLIGDCGVDTGFGQVSHALIDQLWMRYDIHVLAINYYGDPHPIQQKCKLYNPAAKVHGDLYGINRVKPLIRSLKPDVIFLINDPWVAANYAELIEEFTTTPKILYTPVDAPHLKKDYTEPLKIFDHIVGYTQFAVDELKIAGIETIFSNIPHGVDTKLFKPVDMHDARERNGFKDDWFIVNVTCRNQLRKRVDLALYAFSKWVKETNKPTTVKLHYHGAIHDEGWDIMDLAQYLGINNSEDPGKSHLIITAPNITAAEGLPRELMPYIYGVANVGLTATMGEGWDLPTIERMAMKIPMIVPKYSALREWAKGGVHFLELSKEPWFNINGLNTVSNAPSTDSIIEALEKMYTDVDYRDKIATAGYNLVTTPKYRWNTIANQFNTLFMSEIKKKKQEKHNDDNNV